MCVFINLFALQCLLSTCYLFFYGIFFNSAYVVRDGRRVREDLEKASHVDLEPSPRLSYPYSGGFGAGAGAGSGSSAGVKASSPSTLGRELTANERERVAKRTLKLKVSRGKRKHLFTTRCGREVKAIVEACRNELLTREEKDADPDLFLYHEVLQYVLSGKVLLVLFC